MTIRLTPDQENLVKEAVASGLAPSEEDFVSTALRQQRHELETVAAIKRGIADMEAGRVIPHEDAMRQIRETIERAQSD